MKQITGKVFSLTPLKGWRILLKADVLFPSLSLIIFAILYSYTSSFNPHWFLLIPIITFLYFYVSLRFWMSFLLLFSVLYGQLHYEPFLFFDAFPYLKLLHIFFFFSSIFFIFYFSRPYLLSSPLVKLLRALGFVPNISDTEREALDSGTIWVEKEFFKGRPHFRTLFNQPFPHLSQEETQFLNKDTNDLCELCDEWETISKKQIPKRVEDFIKQNKFLGMIIPKKYKGLEFSPVCHAHVIRKLASVDIAGAIFVMVPNSLGPSELLLSYGTQKQKDKYLSRLAEGKEIPCFGLTEPQAGSDANSITSEGFLFKGEDGRLKIKLNWNKRWISLSSIASILGIAFKLKDPENLLGRGKDIGTTCALIPSDTPGVQRGFLHDPMGIPFYNAPLKGEDVIIDAEEDIIGGLDQAGKGWKMLMECLGVGRGISLPSLSIGIARRISYLVSHHARIRKQFGIPIGRFEGVEEPLTRIAGLNYLMEATQNYTLSALNQGLNPPVATAITKYNITELGRKLTMDGMDIMGGAGLTLGPRNTIASVYKSLPISVTVEGANILTRTLIIYGQGALRAHPYAYLEIKALEENDFKKFDKVFWKHLYLILCNTVSAFILSLTRGYSHISFFYLGTGHRFIQKIALSSALFSWLTNFSILFFGAKLKTKEKLTGRFADALSYQYIATALLWNWYKKGRPKEEWILVEWGLNYSFYQIQKAIEGILANFNVPVLGFFMKTFLYFFLRLNSLGTAPSDKLSKKIAKKFLDDESFRERLTEDLYIPKNPEHQFQKLKKAYTSIKESEQTIRKIKQSIKDKKLPKKRVRFLIDMALEKNIISEKEHSNLKKSEKDRWDAIQVDSFSEEEYYRNP